MSDPYLAQHRADAESSMHDRCVMQRGTGRMVQNEDTGREEEIFADLYESKIELQDRGYADSSVEAGGRRIPVGSIVIKLPWGIADPRQNDRVVVTAIGPDTAPRHLGKRFYVSTDHIKSTQSSTRLVVKEDPWQSP